MKNREPEDQVTWPGGSTSGSSAPNKPKGNRRLLVVATVVVVLVAVFVVGRMTGSGHSAAGAVASPSASATDPVTTPPAVVSTTPEVVATTPSPSDSGSDNATADSSGSASGGSGSGTDLPEYLSQTKAVDDEGLNSPIDARISGVDYPDSIQQIAQGGNGTTTEWDVATYSTFTAEVGIDDSTPADGKTARIVFMNQSSVQLGTVQVSVGAPVQVSIPLKGAVHFEIQCTTEKPNDYYYVTFGNAQFLP